MAKVSVLIPLYNRKQYAEGCIGSVLKQTFNDFEIIIRDDCSTDGVFEFVQNNFRDSRIKLFRNDENIGEAETLKLLIKDAAGKYLTILHNDDLYLPNALQILYETAEKFSADVVHSSTALNFGTPLTKIHFDKSPVQKTEILSNDLNLKFDEWFNGKIFRDLQYNIFSRKFVLDAGIFSDISGWNLLVMSLNWIMKAEILVKTPEICYIRRQNPYSQSTAHNTLDYEISQRIEDFRKLDKFISSFDFFRNNDKLRYKIKARVFGSYESLSFDDSPSYGDESFVNLYNSIENTFRKYFGDDAVYLAMMYHWAHLMHFNQNKLNEHLQECIKLLDRKI